MESRAARIKSKLRSLKSEAAKSYLVRTRMLFYGLVFVVIYDFIYPFLNSNYSFDFIYEEGFILKSIIMGAMSFAFGLFYGFMMWFTSGKK